MRLKRLVDHSSVVLESRETSQQGTGLKCCEEILTNPFTKLQLLTSDCDLRCKDFFGGGYFLFCF